MQKVEARVEALARSLGPLSTLVPDVE